MKRFLIIIFIFSYTQIVYSNEGVKCTVKVPIINNIKIEEKVLSKNDRVMYKKAFALYGVNEYCESLSIFTELAKNGFYESHKYIGAILSFGLGIKENKVLGSTYILSAAQHGDLDSQLLAALIYENGKGVQRNLERSRYWYRNAFNKLLSEALKGDRYSQYNLAILYENGKGTSKNINKAIYWYKKASVKGDVEATKRLNHLQKNIAQ